MGARFQNYLCTIKSVPFTTYATPRPSTCTQYVRNGLHTSLTTRSHQRFDASCALRVGRRARPQHTYRTGAEFESGAAYARRGVNEPQPGVEPEPAGPDPLERQAAPQPGQPAARRGQLNIQGNE